MERRLSELPARLLPRPSSPLPRAPRLPVAMAWVSSALVSRPSLRCSGSTDAAPLLEGDTWHDWSVVWELDGPAVMPAPYIKKGAEISMRVFIVLIFLSLVDSLSWFSFAVRYSPSAWHMYVSPWHRALFPDHQYFCGHRVLVWGRWRWYSTFCASG